MILINTTNEEITNILETWVSIQFSNLSYINKFLTNIQANQQQLRFGNVVSSVIHDYSFSSTSWTMSWINFEPWIH